MVHVAVAGEAAEVVASDGDGRQSRVDASFVGEHKKGSWSQAEAVAGGRGGEGSVWIGSWLVAISRATQKQSQDAITYTILVQYR